MKAIQRIWVGVTGLCHRLKSSVLPDSYPTMTLELLSQPTETTIKLDVAFIHGLGGGPIKTWSASGEREDLWTNWLSNDLPSARIWSLAWPCTKFSWSATGEMTVQDRASAAIKLLADKGLGEFNTAFICHSMGGILAKEILKASDTLREESWSKISKNSAAVIFLGTPHTGSALANIAAVLPFRSMSTIELKRNESALRHLNYWYRNYAQSTGIRTLSFFETKPVGSILVVDQNSADPGLGVSVVIPADANHFTICTPASTEDPTYLAIRELLSSCLRAPITENSSPLWTEKVAAFRDSYLSSETGLVPFGGRSKELSALTTWLTDPSRPSRMLITAPAGRGKSALLVQWTKQILDLSDWRVIFVPISIRFSLNQPPEFYRILATQLGKLTKEDIAPPTFDPESYYVDKCSFLINKIASSGQNTVIVIDGVDEAKDNNFKSYIFPTQLPPTLKVVLSARELVNDTDSSGWMTRLSWNEDVRAESFILPKLDEQNVAEILGSIGFDGGQEGNSVIENIYRLSQGEPLLVKLYSDDFREALINHDLSSMRDLTAAPPGIRSYFLRTMELERLAAREEGCNIDDNLLQAAMLILSCAFAPIERDHLLHLTSKLTGTTTLLSINYILRPLRRFIIGKGTEEHGYVLSHPMISQYLREDHFTASQVRAAHSLFIAWAKDIALKNHDAWTNESERIPSYLLQSYVSHLECIRAPLDHYEVVLSEAWRWSWDKYEGGYRGLSADVKSALNRFMITAQHSQADANVISFGFRASLCLASIQSVGMNLPSTLLSLSLDEGALTVSQALNVVDLQVRPNRPQFLSAIFRHLPDDRRIAALEEMLHTDDPGNKISFLSPTLPHLDRKKREEIVKICYRTALTIDHPLQRANAYLSILQYLDSEGTAEVINDVLSLQVDAESNVSYARTLGLMAKQLDPTKYHIQAARLLEKCAAHIDGSGDPYSKAKALVDLSSILPAEFAQRRATLGASLCALLPMHTEQMTGLHELQKESACQHNIEAWAIFTMIGAQSAPNEEYDAKVNDIFAKLENIPTGVFRASAAHGILQSIRDDRKLSFAERCFYLASGLPTSNNRTHAFVELATSAPSSVRSKAIRAALVDAKRIEDDFSQASAMAALFSHLAENEQEDSFDYVRMMLSKPQYVLHKGKVLCDIAMHNAAHSAELFSLGVQLISSASDGHIRVSELINYMAHLPSPLRGQTFRSCFDYIIKAGGPMYVFDLARLADVTVDLWTKEDLERALQVSRASSNIWMTAYLLSSLAAIAVHLEALELVPEFYQSVSMCRDAGIRASGLAKIIPLLPINEDREVAANKAWEELMSSDEPDLHCVNACLSLLPLFIGAAHASRYEATKAAVFKSELNWNTILRLAEHSPTPEEKYLLIQTAFQAALTAKSDVLVPAVAEISRYLSDKLETKRAILDIIGASGVPRTAILGAISRSAPAIKRLGGSPLLCKLIDDIVANSLHWP